jgi:hypothetical protein
MLLADVATAYGVTSKRLAEQIRRNPELFPDDFCFRLSPDEAAKCGIGPEAGGKPPIAMTREGVNMVAVVIRTPTAKRRAVLLVRVFSAIEAGRIRVEMPAVAMETPQILAFQGHCMGMLPVAGQGLVVLNMTIERGLGLRRGAVNRAAQRVARVKQGLVYLDGDRLVAIKELAGLWRSTNVVCGLTLPALAAFADSSWGGEQGRAMAETVRGILARGTSGWEIHPRAQDRQLAVPI